MALHVCGECGERADAPGACPRDGQPLALVEDAIVGTDIARYRIARSIAVGGMARVYLGVQREIGSRVAVKILSEKCAEDPDLVERFFAEARAVNLIAHENIINIIDLAMLDDGRPYIVMEYVEGVTLTRAVRGGRAPLGGVVRVIADVLSAVSAAHEIGIIHRDLKPDNILVTAKGHAKVLDFGIAKLASLPFTAARTVTGALLGTPAYMAPEQINGARDVDAKADIYAVGAVLFHAVTGRSPFAGATMFDIMRAQLEEQPPSPRELRPDLPIAIEQVIARALAKDPANRFDSAAQMAAALDAASITLADDQWFDLSRNTTPMRVRGSGPRLTPPPIVRRDTPPAISAVSLPATESDDAKPTTKRSPHKGTKRSLMPVAIVSAIGAAGVIGFWVASRSSKSSTGVTSQTTTTTTTAPAATTAPQATTAPATTTVTTTAPATATAPAAASGSQKSAPAAASGSPKAAPAAGDGSSKPAPSIADHAGKAKQASKRPLPKLPVKLHFDNTIEVARSVALAQPGVTTAKFVSVTFGGGDGHVGFDTTQGAWVRYRFVIDPPLDEGCELDVTITTSASATPRKGSCTRDGIPYPDCRDFREIWRRAHEMHRWLKMRGIEYENASSGWQPEGDYSGVPDDCP